MTPDKKESFRLFFMPTFSRLYFQLYVCFNGSAKSHLSVAAGYGLAAHEAHTHTHNTQTWLSFTCKWHYHLEKTRDEERIKKQINEQTYNKTAC